MTKPTNWRAPREGSDQLGHPPSLITLRRPHEETLGPQLPIEHTAKTDQTGRIHTQADLSLRWAHRSFCWFCHEKAQIQFFLLYTVRLFNLCAVLDGIACTVVCSGPSLLSATWFPAQQRVTTTAVAVVTYYVGIAFAFVLGKTHARFFFLILGWFVFYKVHVLFAKY